MTSLVHIVCLAVFTLTLCSAIPVPAVRGKSVRSAKFGPSAVSVAPVYEQLYEPPPPTRALLPALPRTTAPPPAPDRFSSPNDVGPIQFPAISNDIRPRARYNIKH